MRHGGKDRKYAYILLLAAAVVLAIGLVLKPNPPEHKNPPSLTELAQLQRLTQQRRLQDLSSYLTDAADAAASSLVVMRPGEHSGVVLDSRAVIVTTATPLGVPAGGPLTSLTPDGRPLALQSVALRTGAPLSAFSFNGPAAMLGAKTPRRPTDLGDWVLAVARNADGAVVFAHGVYQGTVEARCGAISYRSIQSSAPISTALLGGGVFNLEGQFLGLISECEQRPVVIAAESVDEILRQPPTMNGRLEDYYGIRVSGAGANEEARTGSAVQVIAVWARSRGEMAGILPGDVITSADGEPVRSRDDLEALVASDKTGHQLALLRGRRRISLTLSGDIALESGRAEFGFTLAERPLDRQVAVVTVEPGSGAARAGVLTGDLLLRVGATPVTGVAAALRALQEAKSAQKLTLERDGRRYEALAEP